MRKKKILSRPLIIVGFHGDDFFCFFFCFERKKEKEKEKNSPIFVLQIIRQTKTHCCRRRAPPMRRKKYLEAVCVKTRAKHQIDPVFPNIRKKACACVRTCFVIFL
jgi:hypothetical protein